MKENRISVEIVSPISKVFDFTVNPEKTHLWIENIVREVTDTSKVGVGTIFKNLDREGKWTEYEVVRFEPNKTFELKQKGKSYHVLYIYEPLSKNRTKLTYVEWSNEGELKRPFSESVLRKLKRIIEE